jgi:hypothetical protein
MMILTRGSIKFFGNVILIVLFVCLVFFGGEVVLSTTDTSHME